VALIRRSVASVARPHLASQSAVALVVIVLTACDTAALRTEPHPLLSTVLAPRREMSLDGILVSIPAPGHVMVLDVWATSCAPCLKMMPGLQALYEEKRRAGLMVVGVATDDNPGLVLERLRALKVTYPNVVDAEGTVRGALRADSLPTTFVVGRDGRVRVVRIGGQPEDLAALWSAVTRLMAE
jgi:thiol-disulfide isomerase/thioredoxin